MNNYFMRKITLFLFLLLCANGMCQRHEVLDESIASLQVVADDNWLSLPMIELRSHQHINIGFDDLSHTYRRFAYKIEHCESDWTVSDQLFQSDFIDGFATGNLIEDIEESINTTVLYTHYSFSIPNRQCRLKMSGNYRVTIYDDNDDARPVATACFMVVDRQMGVQLDVTTNTDIDVNNRHQQVVMQLNYGNVNVVNPSAQIKTVVVQNQQWNDARINAKPQYVMNNGLRWEHCRDYIFDGGNEYHKFEVLDPTHPTMGVDRIDWDGESYQVYVFPDMPVSNYIYDEDANGCFYIRNSDNYENDRTSDYVFVNFELHVPYRYNGDVYVNGVWTNNRFMPENKMAYDHESRCYRASILLKQGYYSYNYLLHSADGTVGLVPSEGNFFQTENSYTALVYYRELGGRSDLLIGEGHIGGRRTR